MASPTQVSAPARADDGTRPAVVGLAVALALMGLAVAVPAVLDWNVRVRWWPPLHAVWDPRVGPGTVPAVALAAFGTWYAGRHAESLPWRTLLVTAYAVGLAWMVSLATVDGLDGIARVLEDPYEYLRRARLVDGFDGVHSMLQEYVSRITYAAYPRNWPVHLAGHPPGAVLVYVLLVDLGLGGGLAAGLVTTAVAASTAPAVLVTARLLGGETPARRAAPFLVLGPAAIWQCVSADAMFAAVGAWGLAALAAAAVATRTRPLVVLSAVAGLLLGYAVMMSYGLWLLGILAVTVLALAQVRRDEARLRPWGLVLPVTAVCALAVVLVFAALGFNYLAALPEIHQRYWEGVAGRRPEAYWIWGNLAAFAFSAGPAVGAGLGALWARRRDASVRTVAVLAAAGWATVATADASQMSRAEVERIWLPFVPWCLLACGLLPERLRRPALVVQVVAALLVQHALVTTW